MKIIILTQYFPPEVGAPQNRLFELAVRLQRSGDEVMVMTAMPNYPQMRVHDAYRSKFYAQERMEGLSIYRSWIYVSKGKGIFTRLLNYFSFVITSFLVGVVKLPKADYIICESPPLFLGITAVMLKWIKRAKLVFNVSDLWPESAEKLGLVTNQFALRSATKLEEFLYRKSDLISGQTQGIVKDIQRRFPQKRIHWLPNGVDLAIYNVDESNQHWRHEAGFEEDDFLVLYAGIIGHAQGLEIVPKAAELLRQHSKIKFLLVGSGPVKDEIVSAVQTLALTNVYFFDAVSKSQMPAIVAASDVALVPLRKLDLFKGAIPSKIFENLAMKKPILLGVEGEAKELFIDQGHAGLFFEPENAAAMVQAIVRLYQSRETLNQLGENGYQYVQMNFTRDKLATDFRQFLLQNLN